MDRQGADFEAEFTRLAGLRESHSRSEAAGISRTTTEADYPANAVAIQTDAAICL